MAKPVDFVNHLRRQFRYIEQSCASYDAGHRDEAIRMATCLRVLVHNSRTSKSLLSHLGMNSTQLLSTAEGASGFAFEYIGLGMMEWTNGHGRYVPTLGDGPINNLMPAIAWWNQIIMILNGIKITRKNIILGAANRDGGVHVDEKLSPEYEALARDGAIGTFTYVADGQYAVGTFRDAHLVSLRQMAFEVLNSPDLNKLVV